MTAASEMERALREILFARAPEQTPKLVDGALIERIERIARAAIERFGSDEAAGAFDLAERSFPGKYWLFAKGRVRTEEPLYGFRVFDPGNTDDPIAEGEHDDPVECVRMALKGISQATGEGGSMHR
jgi:hypothetical protein